MILPQIPIQSLALMLTAGTLRLAIYMIGFGVIEKFFPCRPVQRIFRQDFVTDCWYFILNAPVGSAFSLALDGTLVFLFWNSWEEFDQWLATSRSPLPLWSQLILTLLILDFIFYWEHRAFHRFEKLWRIHAIHHSSVELNWLSTSREHVLELFLFYVLVPRLVSLLGFDPIVFVYGGLFKSVYNYLLHANVPWGFGYLGKYLASPRFHRWHHDVTSNNKNFATMFPFYDRLFGTWHLPEEGFAQTLGVPNAVIPDSVVLQQFYPFISKQSGA